MRQLLLLTQYSCYFFFSSFSTFCSVDEVAHTDPELYFSSLHLLDFNEFFCSYWPSLFILPFLIFNNSYFCPINENVVHTNQVIASPRLLTQPPTYICMHVNDKEGKDGACCTIFSLFKFSTTVALISNPQKSSFLVHGWSFGRIFLAESPIFSSFAYFWQDPVWLLTMKQ